MAKRTDTQTPMFGPIQQQIEAQRRARRRQRALFIPKYVADYASSVHRATAAENRAFEIICKWADLESSGKLYKHKETTIDTQFLDQIFSEGLGYNLKTNSPDDYQLEHKFPVKGVGTADAALSNFPTMNAPQVVIELKAATIDLDRDRISGRTPVQQCWDYLNAIPDCSWGIVSNFSTIRLYHKSKGSQTYEEFELQDLRNRTVFDKFYAIFARESLLRVQAGVTPKTQQLLDKTSTRQKDVGDELYEHYRRCRNELIAHLNREHGKDLDTSIAIAQKILDRVVFIAFCESRGLLPERCLESAFFKVPAFARVKNPRWQNFLGLFAQVDKGNPQAKIQRFNGGLFADDELIDSLELDDDPWGERFKIFGNFDYTAEVNVDVLGQLFERSITELEKLRVGGLFALTADSQANSNFARSTGKPKSQSSPPQSSKMSKSAQRKRFGIYYTPPAFTGLIVERTVDAIIKQRFEDLAAEQKIDLAAPKSNQSEKLRHYWRSCHHELTTITVCDPACGSGAFLIRAYDALEAHYSFVVHALAGAGEDPQIIHALESQIPDDILANNLFGVDLSREGVEITQLALWIRSARPDKTLADLSKNIVQGNSLVSDPSVDPKALDWHKTFPKVFASDGTGGFSCVIGNPPWERVKVQDREFFSLTDPQTAEAVSAADRKKRIAAMPKVNPELHASYESARERAQKLLDYARQGDRYPLTGKGDINLYMLFAELARSIVAPSGRAGLLVPSGIATDDTTKEFFNDLMDRKALVSLYDFENKEGHFEDVHRSFKFTSIIFSGGDQRTEQADFVFFARDVDYVAESNKQRHIALTASDMKLLNPNTRTCPIFRTRRDADLTRAIYKRVPILIDENRKQGGNPWGIKFLRMFDQTNDAEHFAEGQVWEKKGYRLSGNVYVNGKKRALPLYEAKMVQAFDHRAASVVVEDENWVRQGQKTETSLVQHANPEFVVMPRWWVEEDAVGASAQGRERSWLLVYKDITSATNERTMIAAFTPWTATVNSAPIIFVGESIAPRLETCLLGNLNAFAFDFAARQKVGALHLNYFIVEQLPTLPPDTYADKCPWAKKQTLEHWISERVLKVSCTAEDMIPLAKACDFKGSRGDGVHLWKEAERAQLRAELDAAYFILYGIAREDVVYILSTFTGTGYVKPEDRTDESVPFARHSQGELILEIYDQLTGLASA